MAKKFKIKSLYFTNNNKTHKCGEILDIKQIAGNPQDFVDAGFLEAVTGSELKEIEKAEAEATKAKKKAAEAAKKTAEAAKKTAEEETAKEDENKTKFITLENDPILGFDDVKKDDIINELKARKIDFKTGESKETLFKKLL